MEYPEKMTLKLWKSAACWITSAWKGHDSFSSLRSQLATDGGYQCSSFALLILKSLHALRDFLHTFCWVKNLHHLSFRLTKVESMLSRFIFF